MEEQFEIYRHIIDNLYDAVYYVDNKRRILYWNKAAEKLTGYSSKEVLESYCWNNILRHVDDKGNEMCKLKCPLHFTIQDGKFREGEFYLHHKSGHRVPIYVRTIPMKNDHGDIVGAIEIFSDNSERKVIKEKLAELEKAAMIDELTQLPNRRYLDSVLKSKYEEYKSNGMKFAAAYFDIDFFKKFNDKYGHDVGDMVLKTVSDTFINNIKGIDIIGRWGGEEFVGIFSISDKDNFEAYLNKIRLLVKNTTVKTEKEELNITISVGATFIEENDDIGLLLKRADSYLYESKERGRNRVTIK